MMEAVDGETQSGMIITSLLGFTVHRAPVCTGVSLDHSNLGAGGGISQGYRLQAAETNSG